jgi:hypothetical protein
MVRHRLSASRLDLAAQCLYWARGDVPVPPRESGLAADTGSAGHEAWAEDAVVSDALRVATGGTDLDALANRWDLPASARERLVELYDSWARWWPGFSRGATWRTEVPYAYDTATGRGRELPRGEHRAYLTTPTEIPGTIDAEHVGSGRAIVVDFKSGHWVPKAADARQLLHGALNVSLVHGVGSVLMVMARVHESGVYVDQAEADSITLAAHAAWCSGRIGELPSAQPRPGHHCSDEWCPAMGVCEGPRQAALVVPDLARHLPVVSINSEQQAAMVLGAAKPLEAYIKELKRQAAAYADAHGGEVRMPDGTVMRRITKGRRTLDVDNQAVHRELRKRFGDDGYARLVKQGKPRISVPAIEKEARARAPAVRGGKTAAAKEVIAVLETTGGLKVNTYQAWDSDDDVAEA